MEIVLDKSLCNVSKHDVLKFCEGDASLAREVVRIFCERVIEYHLPEIKTALLNKDIKKLRFHLDTLNGSSGYVGAEYLRWLCSQISKNIREGINSGNGGGGDDGTMANEKWYSDITNMVKELEIVSERTVENLKVMEI